jgi:WhiB family redox-sensing transcriptional regulator
MSPALTLVMGGFVIRTAPPFASFIGGIPWQGEAPGGGGTGMVAARRHWRTAAACQFADPDLFFPISSSGLALEQVAEAKEICARCQVRPECLAFALRTQQVHGVWGGMSEQERHPLLRRDDRRINGGAGDRNPRRFRPDDNPAPDRRARQR